ncbi:hypothetical protein J6590_064224 [Homalodisca vitripennis]|nr:hypothetical protein J6590_064224 [Homalodisca vitripennis]
MNGIITDEVTISSVHPTEEFQKNAEGCDNSFNKIFSRVTRTDSEQIQVRRLYHRISSPGHTAPRRGRLRSYQRSSEDVRIAACLVSRSSRETYHIPSLAT